MDLADLILSEAIDQMTDDGREAVEVALALTLTGLDYLEENACCDRCLAEALDQIRDRLSVLQRAQPGLALH
jgi:hypothetical protein